MKFKLTRCAQIHIELLEILELYCELLMARFGLVESSR